MHEKMVSPYEVIGLIKREAHLYHINLAYQDVLNLACLMQAYCYYLTGHALINITFVRSPHGPMSQKLIRMLQSGASEEDLYEFEHELYLEKIAELIDLLFKTELQKINEIFLDKGTVGTAYTADDLLNLFQRAFDLTEEKEHILAKDSSLDSSLDSAKYQNADDLAASMQQEAINKERRKQEAKNNQEQKEKHEKIAQQRPVNHATDQDIMDLLLEGTEFEDSSVKENIEQQKQELEPVKQHQDLKPAEQPKPAQQTENEDESLFPTFSEEPVYRPKKKKNNNSDNSGVSYHDLQDDDTGDTGGDSSDSDSSNNNNTDAGAFNAANGDSDGDGIPDYLEDDDIFDHF